MKSTTLSAFASALKRRLQAGILTLAFFATSQAGASPITPITYAVSIFGITSDGTLGIGGSITTDGTLGPLSESNIIDWDLIGAAQNNSGATIFNFRGLLSGQNSSRILTGVTIVATKLTLEFDPSTAGGVFGFSRINQFPVSDEHINFQAIPDVNVLRFFVMGSNGVSVFFDTPLSSSLVFADGKSVPDAAPLPAALPLFAGGFGVIGLLARCRKQRQASRA